MQKEQKALQQMDTGGKGGKSMVEKSEYYFDSSNGKNKLHMVVWKPDQGVKAVLQISHGMTEHIERYDRFAAFLAGKGYLVAGNDHLGHGKSVKSPEEYGYFHAPDGSEAVIKDLHEVTERIKGEYPGVPYFVMGHSMGSFFIRRYLMTYGKEVDGAIIMGTGNPSFLKIRAGKLTVSLLKLLKGETYRSSFVKKMGFWGYNKKFRPLRTENDWLTKDTAVLDSYLLDQSCTFTFTLNGYETLMNTLSFITNPKNIKKLPQKLPVCILSGSDDPVGGNGREVCRVYQIYKKQGLIDLKCRLYPGDRHELINELDYEKIYQDIWKWLEIHRRKKQG